MQSQKGYNASVKHNKRPKYNVYIYVTYEVTILPVMLPRIESVPLPGRHGDTQTNKPLNRDDWGLTKLPSTRD